jgi:magnesium chelatase family protein
VPALAEEELLLAREAESSAAVRERVASAHAVQVERQGRRNAELSGREVEESAPVEAGARRLLREAIAHHRLSARAHHRVLKVARTVADLEGCGALCERHVAEALLYRGIAAPSSITAATA